MDSWGDTFAQQEVSFADASGILSIAIDKTTTFVNGSAQIDGEHKGEIYAKHIRQVIIQDGGAAATVTIEGVYVGTRAEMLVDMGYHDSENHVLKVSNCVTKSSIWDNATTYTLNTTLTSGKKYTVSAKICAPDITSVNAVKFVLSEGSTKYGVEFYIFPNTFHEISQEFTAGDNTKLEIQFGFANGVVFIDDVSCVEKGATTNLIENGDFEEPLSTEGWSVASWSGLSISQAEQGIDEVSLPALKFTIGAAEYTTICSTGNIQVPAGVKAYYAKYNSENDNIKLTPVTTIKQYSCAILNGAAGDYYFPQIPASEVTSDTDDNELKPSWSGDKESDGTFYVLAKKNDVVGFYKLASGQKVPAGKAYLVISSGNAPEFVGIGGTTGIDATLNEGVEMTDGVIFDLSGRRVANPTKGIYIKNGKKFIVK